MGEQSNQEDKEDEMSSAEDSIIEEEIREMWWEQGEAVMREMCEEDDG